MFEGPGHPLGPSRDLYRGLRGWRSPGDVASLLMIMNGDIVQKAIAQLCGPRLVPVAFSFGWVVYSIQALSAVLGTGRLMPTNPDWESIVINLDSGYVRANRSWILGRLLRDWDYKPKDKQGLCITFLDAVRRENAEADRENYRLDAGLPGMELGLHDSARQVNPDEETGSTSGIEAHPLKFDPGLTKSIAVANRMDSNISWLDRCHRVMMSKMLSTSRVVGGLLKPRCLKMDNVWLFAWVMIIFQFVMAGVPIVRYHELSTMMFTIAGTILALWCGSLQQWSEEKWCYRETVNKNFCLTQGNGSQHVIVVRGNDVSWDFEFLASGRIQRNTRTTILVALQAFFWLGLLVAIARKEGQTWFLMLVGAIGTFQNIVIAAAPRKPSAFGIYLEEQPAIHQKKVRDALLQVDQKMPLLAQTLFPIFFPGRTDSTDRKDFKVTAAGQPVVDEEVTQQEMMRAAEVQDANPAESPIGGEVTQQDTMHAAEVKETTPTGQSQHPAEVVEGTSSGREAAGADGGSHETHSLLGGEQ